MKRLIKLLPLLVALACAVLLLSGCRLGEIRNDAFVNRSGVQYTLTDDGDAYYVSGFDSKSMPSHVKIADRYNGKPVTYIGDNAFKGALFSSIEIPDGITRIGNHAFENCERLVRIAVPESVTSIDYRAFYGCKHLAEIRLADHGILIWTEAFADTAYFLDTSNWENGALYIGKHLIKAMASGEFVVKEGTVSIGGGAFEDCGDLTGVLLPSTVTAVGHFAFQSCTGLKSITLPAGMTRIYGTAFHQSGITDAFFENPNGWYLQNTLTDVSDPSVAATYLKLPVYTPWERREVAPPHGQS